MKKNLRKQTLSCLLFVNCSVFVWKLTIVQSDRTVSFSVFLMFFFSPQPFGEDELILLLEKDLLQETLSKTRFLLLEELDLPRTLYESRLVRY